MWTPLEITLIQKGAGLFGCLIRCEERLFLLWHDASQAASASFSHFRLRCSYNFSATFTLPCSKAVAINFLPSYILKYFILSNRELFHSIYHQGYELHIGQTDEMLLALSQRYISH